MAHREKNFDNIYKKYINWCFNTIEYLEIDPGSVLECPYDILNVMMNSFESPQNIFLDKQNKKISKKKSEKMFKPNRKPQSLPVLPSHNVLLVQDEFASTSDANPKTKSQTENTNSKTKDLPTDTEPLDIWDIVSEIKQDVKSDTFDDMESTESIEELNDLINQPDSTNKKLSASKSKHKDNPKSNVLSDPRITLSKGTVSSNKKTKRKASCDECKAKNSMIEDERRCCIVCSECGFQKEKLLESGPEWHQYNNDDGRGEGVNRCGSSTSYYFPRSTQGTIITGFTCSRLGRKQKWNSTNYKENTLNKDFDIITQLCLKNNISKNIIDEAKFLYKKISDCKYKEGKNEGKAVIIRGSSRDCVIGACIYKGCETMRDPRTKREIANLIGKEEKKLSKGIKKFEKIMKNSDDNILENMHDGTPEDQIRRYCPKLKMRKEDIDLATKIAANCAKLKLATDHGAISIGAGITMLVVKYSAIKNIDKKEIGFYFETSDVTITKIYNKIAPYADALVDDEITEHIIKKFKVNG